MFKTFKQAWQYLCNHPDLQLDGSSLFGKNFEIEIIDTNPNDDNKYLITAEHTIINNTNFEETEPEILSCTAGSFEQAIITMANDLYTDDLRKKEKTKKEPQEINHSNVIKLPHQKRGHK